eukprot:scaffold1477_cov188-Alexandrium_tamarense.AAC.47
MTPSGTPTRRLGSSSFEQWGDIVMEDAATRAENISTIAKLSVPSKQQTQASKELDIALQSGARIEDDNDESGAPNNIDEETNTTKSQRKVVSPDNSFENASSEGSPKRERRRSQMKRRDVEPASSKGGPRRERRRSQMTRSDVEPAPSTTKLVLCGATLNISETKGIIQDAKESLRQIFTTVRRFGPDEKEAVRATLKDAKDSVKDTLRSAVGGKCGGRHQEEE